MKRLVIISVVLAGLILTAEASRRRLLTASSGSGGGGGGYTASSVDFSGVNQNITFSGSAVTMSGAGQAFTMSCWLNVDSDGGSMYAVMARNGTSGSLWRLYRHTDNSIRVLAQDSTPTTILDARCAANVLEAADGWVHFYMSIDLSSTGNRAIYLNGSSASVTWTTYNTAGILALDRTHVYLGTDDANGNDYDGQLAELWIDDAYWPAATYIGNFISGGNPVSLGSDGSTPTGAAPDLYMKFVSGSLGVNSGADGGTGTLNGPPTDGPTFP